MSTPTVRRAPSSAEPDVSRRGLDWIMGRCSKRYLDEIAPPPPSSPPVCALHVPHVQHKALPSLSESRRTPARVDGLFSVRVSSSLSAAEGVSKRARVGRDEPRFCALRSAEVSSRARGSPPWHTLQTFSLRLSSGHGKSAISRGALAFQTPRPSQKLPT